jgi:3-oxoacyl-[acyl-carrier protein] reductase
VSPVRRVALVTGAAKGIGAGIALRLAADGFDTAVNYSRSADEAGAIVERLRAHGVRSGAFQADVGDVRSAQQLVEEVTASLGPPTVLVNNAAVHLSKTVLKQRPDDWDQAIRVNLSGPFYCTHFALPAMYEQAWGRVVFIGSGVGRRGFPGDGSYAAAKAGLAGLARCLALETANYGITVNTVIPGFVLTDMTRNVAPHVLSEIQTAVHPVEPADVAAVVSFLCREEAWAVTGEEIGAIAGGTGALPRKALG